MTLTVDFSPKGKARHFSRCGRDRGFDSEKNESRFETDVFLLLPNERQVGVVSLFCVYAEAALNSDFGVLASGYY
jgi:hypothetical protein